MGEYCENNVTGNFNIQSEKHGSTYISYLVDCLTLLTAQNGERVAVVGKREQETRQLSQNHFEIVA